MLGGLQMLTNVKNKEQIVLHKELTSKAKADQQGNLFYKKDRPRPKRNVRWVLAGLTTLDRNNNKMVFVPIIPAFEGEH